jgi:hypothetical protein
MLAKGQLSLNTGVTIAIDLAQLPKSLYMLILGSWVITGVSLSFTVIVNTLVLEPHVFVAVTVSVVVPLLNASPDPVPEPLVVGL